MEQSDLQAKYHKLATEYAKLRAQNQVLKKAVVEEQEKSSRAKESTKLLDQSIRKLEQELDSTTFRNRQLLKRLSILQDELDSLQIKGNKKHHLDAAMVLPNESVYMEELQLKIDENVKLHAKLSDMEDAFNGRISELEGMQSSLEQEIVKSGEDFKNKEVSLKSQILDLENEKIISEVSLHQKKAQILKVDDKPNNQEDPTFPPADSNRLKKELVIDTLGAQRKEKGNAKSIVKSFEQPVLCLSSSFCSFLRLYSFEIKQGSPHEPLQLKVLAEEEMIWQNLATTFSSFISSIEKDEKTPFQIEDMFELQHVSKAVTSCAASLRKVLPVLTEKIGSNTKTDAPWRCAIGRFVSCWAAVTPHVTSLASFNEKRNECNSSIAIKAANSLDEKLQRLHSSSLDLTSSWQTFSGSRGDNGVLKSLETIMSALELISSLFTSRALPHWNQICSTPSTPSSVSVCTPINIHPPTLSMSHDVSGWSGSSIDSATVPCSDTSLVQQVAITTNRLSKLEEEKEHWKLEYHLLSHRIQTEKTEFTGSAEDRGDSCVESEKSEVIANHSILAEVSGDISFEEREAEIRAHYNSRCASLHKQLMWASCQAALYQTECETIMKRLEISERVGAISEKEIESLREKIVELQELLQTTSRNYDEQISTMSDHLADLNDKLTSQQEIIEDMLYQNNRKLKK